MKTRGLGAAALALTALAAGSAGAQNAAEFYKGKTLNMVVGSAPGGGYDAYGRLVARHLGSHIPGDPTVVVQNMPGAAQTKAAAYIYSVAPKDGTQIGAVSPGALLTPILGGPHVQYDPKRFQFVGSANSDVYVCIARPDAPVKAFKDVFDKPLVVGVSGGSTTLMLPLMLKNLLHADFKLVRGYPGTKGMEVALERGEIQGICGLGWSSLSTEHRDWVANKTVNVLVQESVDGLAELNKMGVPRAYDFARTDEQKKIMEIVYSQGVFGRPYVMAPETPKDRMSVVRKAFVETMHDPALLADAAKIHLGVGDPLSGNEVEALIAKIYATSPAIIQRTRAVLETNTH